MPADSPATPAAVRAATCPACGSLALDPVRLDEKGAAGMMPLRQIFADMLGHVQEIHPAQVETFLRAGEQLGMIGPPPEWA